MGMRQSAEVGSALQLVAGGKSPYAAAKQVGIAFSTMYRAIERHRKINGLTADQFPPQTAAASAHK